MPMRLHSVPVIVLGNAPHLPVDDLPHLSSAFTIGVNRILLSGFEPTVVVYNDVAMIEHIESIWDTTNALIVKTSKVEGPAHAWLKRFSQRDAKRFPCRGRTFLQHNTGAAAIRWARGLTRASIYSLGISTRHDDGPQHFHGESILGGHTFLRMLKELGEFRAMSNVHMRYTVDEIPQMHRSVQWSQNELRSMVLSAIGSYNWDQVFCDRDMFERRHAHDQDHRQEVEAAEQHQHGTSSCRDG